jgi:Carboxypeptidase regulatory-like domain
MSYKNAFRFLEAFSFIALIVLSSTAVAKARSGASTDSQKPAEQLAGIVVSLEQVSGTKILSTKTDEKGSFSFSNVVPGSYKLRIGCAKADAAPPDVTAQAPAPKCYAEMRIVITDKSMGVITGSIRKEGG